jgi:hypothetical protein
VIESGDTSLWLQSDLTRIIHETTKHTKHTKERKTVCH